MIDGMSCGHCTGNVKDTLTSFSTGEVEVSLEGKYAVLETSADDAALREAIDDIGFDVVDIINL
ncbi:heavy-metal-associated domain-containing protein [Cellulosilyticum ruminicola]|uniref:heavy-metal-associated domain-containing protein n=1 Tax=Cellulosilyticum ruminicola TaxID=425254 RepID=UPI0006CFC24C|nr:heavy metal-associated domain-containing protein [Cellulosilyticum ruminicola]